MDDMNREALSDREAARRRLQQRQARLHGEAVSDYTSTPQQSGNTQWPTNAQGRTRGFWRIASQQSDAQESSQRDTSQTGAYRGTTQEDSLYGDAQEGLFRDSSRGSSYYNNLQEDSYNSDLEDTYGETSQKSSRRRATQQSSQRGASRRGSQQSGNSEGFLSKLSAACSGAFENVRGFFSSLSPQQIKILLGALALIVALLLIVAAVRACSANAGAGEEAAPTEESTEETTPQQKNDTSGIDKSSLESLMGSSYSSALIEAAGSDDDAFWIASNPSSYATDGESVQAKLLTLAAKEPAARSFVRNWPSKYPETKATGNGSPSDTTSTTSVPHLYQWDERWGYTTYSSTTFALTGCCPTSLAMVYQGLMGDTSYTPYTIGQMAAEMGYEDSLNGTQADFLTAVAPTLGLSCTTLDATVENLVTELQDGHVIILAVGPGDFTTSSHYLVACGLAGDNEVIVNDPFSAINSNRTWNSGTLIKQTQQMYVYESL